MTVTAEIDPQNPTKILLNAEYRYHTLLRLIPTAKFLKNMEWHVSLNWQTCLALRSALGNNLVLGPNLVTWAKDLKNEYIDPLMQMRVALDAPGYTGLYDYQRAGVAYLAHARRAFLCDGLGSGKTRQALSAIRRLYEMGENPFPVLVACPNSTKIAWSREAEIVWPGITTTVIGGSAAKRRKLFEKPAHIYIINWESLRGHSRLAPYGSMSLKKCDECGGASEDVTVTQCETHLRELNKIDFRTVIGDEIHRIKDGKAKVTRAFKSATGDAEFRFGLSGTPIADTPDDLWSELNWLLPEAYPSKVKYQDQFLDVSMNAWGATIVTGIKYGKEREFFLGVDPHLRRMPKEIVLKSLPPITRERRDVEMSPKQRKAYNQMKDQMVAELDEGQRVITTSPLTKMTRLLQFSSSYATIEWREVTDKETGELVNKPFVRLADPSCKLDAFMTDIEDFSDESVVVFAVSSQLINMLSDRLTKAKIPHGKIIGGQSDEERQANMDEFQSGKTKFILCTIAAGGTGVTLTKASTMVFLQRSWSMIENTQSEGRAHRIGSEIHDRILIIDYVTIDSAEQAVIQADYGKGEQLQVILRDADLLRHVLENNNLDKPEDENDRRDSEGDVDDTEARGEETDS